MRNNDCGMFVNQRREPFVVRAFGVQCSGGRGAFFIYDNMSRTPVADFLRENARD